MGSKNWERAASRYFAEKKPGFVPQAATVALPETLEDFMSSHAGKIAKRLLRAADIAIILVNRKRKNCRFVCIFLDGEGLFITQTYVADRLFKRSEFPDISASSADARRVEESFTLPPFGGLVRLIRETLEEIAGDAP